MSESNLLLVLSGIALFSLFSGPIGRGSLTPPTDNLISTILGMMQKLKYQDVQDFVCGFWRHVGRIVNYATRVAAKSTDKKTSEIGILINASSLTLARKNPLRSLRLGERHGFIMLSQSET